MRITILTSRELASYYALSHLLGELSDHHLSVFIHNEHRHYTLKPTPLLELEAFEERMLEKISLPFQNQIAGGVEVLNAINSAAGLSLLKSTKPDLVVSIRYGTILKEQAIAVSRLGIINLHSGALPAYKGVMATFRAMLNGDRYAGTTLHVIKDSSIDTGPIISASKTLLDYSHSYLWNVMQLYPPGCQLILNAIHDIQQRGLVNTYQPAGTAAYYSYPMNDEFSKFAERGYKLFDENEMTDFLRSSAGLNIGQRD